MLDSIQRSIFSFGKHRHARGRDATTGSLHRTLSVHTTAIEQTYMTEECDENDYHLDLDSYKPVQPIKIDHGVALFPVAAPHTGMDLHLLQVRSYILQHIYAVHIKITFLQKTMLLRKQDCPNKNVECGR